MFSLDFIYLCEDGGIKVQGRLRMELFKSCGDGATVHNKACGRGAEGGDSVGRIRGCVGRDSWGN